MAESFSDSGIRKGLGRPRQTDAGPRWPWVAESHLPPVLLWCTFRKVKRIAKSVAIVGDVSVSETKEVAPNFKPQTSQNTGTSVSSGF